MQAFLDGQALAPTDQTFAAAVAAASIEAGKKKRIIVEVLADGGAVDDACLSNPAQAMVKAARIDFTSEPPEKVVSKTLGHAADVLNDTRAQQLAAAEQLQLGEHEEAFKQLGPVLETWAAVQSALNDSAAVLHVSVETMGGTSIELKPLISDLSANLANLKTAIKSQDWSSAADTLAYDLDTQCERWGVALRKLSSALSQSGS